MTQRQPTVYLGYKKKGRYGMKKSIDMIQTGRHLKKLCEDAKLKPVDIQRLTQLSYPQSIYRWYQGDVLPSVDHLYTLSRVLDMHIEDMLVPAQADELYFTIDRKRKDRASNRRVRRYYSNIIA